MAWLIVKYALTAAIVVAASELAKRSDQLGALVGALPMVTVMALIWLHVEGQPQAKIASHALFTFWYVLPTLPMFLLFPLLLTRLGFWPALGAGVLLTVICFAALACLMRRYGIDLI